MSDSESSEYRKDSRTPCRYGAKCYQKNPTHLQKYKHPLQNHKRKLQAGQTAKKKIKTENEQPSISNSNNGNEPMNSKEITKKECVSESEPSDSEDPPPVEQINQPVDPKEFIKKNFLLDLPTDFYEFWEFCKHLKPQDPGLAFKDVDLKLVGPFDVLAGKFETCTKTPEEIVLHWRYYYDPPEFLTVIKGPDNTGYHIGYFYDSPEEKSVFLAGNHGTKDGEFTKIGDNIFAAVVNYLEEKIKNCDPFKKMSIGRVITSIKNKAEKLNYNLSSHSQKIKDRDHKIVSKTFNKIGLVVPYDRKSQLGYRDLAIEDKELMTLLNKLDTASPEQKPRFLSELQPVLTYANIALDECDFGTGVKLGWQLLFHRTDCLNSTISQFLCNSYRLLGKEAFARIAEVHFKNRKKGCQLSIL